MQIKTSKFLIIISETQSWYDKEGVAWTIPSDQKSVRPPRAVPKKIPHSSAGKAFQVSDETQTELKRFFLDDSLQRTRREGGINITLFITFLTQVNLFKYLP